MCLLLKKSHMGSVPYCKPQGRVRAWIVRVGKLCVGKLGLQIGRLQLQLNRSMTEVPLNKAPIPTLLQWL